ncbi:hypothetical protein TrCOL_g5815 [Triparma columacea]|uniref:WW domain-containing protein n=1 Tax=Triparma columacea TaxID=722753 RepID=A0A9W7L919_9STRA|nr:hypothetical protein TrCOL_g5815 [Triparma columacea]
MLSALICLCFYIRLSSASNHVTSHWMLTNCVSECSNSRCPSGHRIYSGEWYQFTATDSYGNSYDWCWPTDEKCKCYACNVGHFDSATDCTKCPGGTIQPALGQTSCSACSSGYVSNEDRTVCDQCGAGKYAALTTCQSCVPGTYSAAGAAVCSPCQPGSFSGSSSSSCTSCTAGKYTLDVTVTECTPCSAGKYASEDGAGACSPCLAGTLSAEGASSCSDCAAGTYTLGGSGECSVCPAGTYSNAGSAACTPCGAGTFSEESASSCYDCAVGKYRLASTNGCQDCAAGRYVDSVGSSFCSLCSAGTSSGEGAASCVDCQQGKYSSVGQATPCDDCSPGRYQDVEGSSTCDECGRGKYSLSAAPSCSDCEEGKWSVRGGGACYVLATGFETCPVHPTSDHPVDNECNFLFEGSWTEVDEGESSSFGSTCASLALCEHVSSETEDDYYIMCAECAQGKVALGYNEVTRGDCNTTRSYPMACVDPQTLSSCPDGESFNDDCEYYHEGDWESKDGGDNSPFASDACGNYSACHVDYGLTSRKYHLSCTQCAEGLLAFYDSAGDDSDDVPQSCHGEKVSECYSAQLYATCPDQIGINGDSSSYLNNLAKCTYVGKTGYGGDVNGNQPSPFITSCSQYELVSKSRQITITTYGFAYDYTISCKKCNEGLEAGDFITVGEKQYIGSCYAPPEAGSTGDFAACNAGGDNHGKEVVCRYLNGSNIENASWVDVGWEDEAPGDLKSGCALWEMCSYESDDATTTMEFMCKMCKVDHNSVYNAVVSGTCASQGVYSTSCAFVGVATPRPTAAPTMAPQPATPSPTMAPTSAPTIEYNFFDDVMSKLNKAASNNLEIFMGIVALLMCSLGLGVYKCYAMQKEKLLYDDNGERLRERRMWSFDEEDVISSGLSSGGNMRRGDGSSGYSAHTEMRRLATDYSTSDMINDDDDDYDNDDADWTVRTDPNGNKYFENTRTRTTTWTEPATWRWGGNLSSNRKQNSTRRGEPYPEFDRDDSSNFGYASNPMQANDEGSSSGIGSDARQLDRLRANSHGAKYVPKLTRKGSTQASTPQAPPPPPQGWSRAVDAKGREYFYNEAGRTVWHVSECD